MELPEKLIPYAYLQPEAVVATRRVFHDRGDPDSVKAHALNVIEVIEDATPSSTTVL